MVAAVTPPPPEDWARNINRAVTSEEKREVNSTGKATVAWGSSSNSCVSIVKSGDPSIVTKYLMGALDGLRNSIDFVIVCDKIVVY